MGGTFGTTGYAIYKTFLPVFCYNKSAERNTLACYVVTETAYTIICDPLWEKGYFRAKIRNCVKHTIRKRYACCIRWRKPHVRRPFRSSTIRLNVRTLTRALFREIARGISITQYKRRRRPQLGRDAASARSGKSMPLQREKVDAKAWFSPATKSRITIYQNRRVFGYMRLR